MPLLQLKDVDLKIKDTFILRKINLSFYLNEFVVILGKSGVGKSTLLNILDYSYSPSKGEMLFNNKKLNKKEQNYVKQNYIKRIHQNHNLIDYYNVIDNIKLINILQGISDDNYSSLLEKLKIHNFQKREISSLSGGEKQRVSIVRSICSNPLIILADEPTGSLDEKNAKEVMKFLHKNKKGKCIIMVTHNEELAKSYADRIITLNEDFSYQEEILNKIKNEEIDLIISKSRPFSFINYFKLNMNSFLKRKKNLISMFIISFIMSTFLLLFFGIEGGLNNFLNSQIKDKIDNNYFQFYYLEDGVIKDFKDPFIHSSFEYEIDIPLSFIYNNLLYEDLKINERIPKEYFEFSFIKTDLNENEVYVNQLFIETFGNNINLSLSNDLYYYDLQIVDVLNETTIYNTPRIILSYDWVKKIIMDSEEYNNLLSLYPGLLQIKDYYFYENINDIYKYIEKNNIVSFYQSKMVEKGNFYVFNNSVVMLKQTFQELFTTTLELIKMLGMIVFFLLSFLVILINDYALLNRKYELGIIKDCGGNSDTFLKVIMSDLLLIFSLSYFGSLLLVFFISLLINDNSKTILNISYSIKILDLSIFDAGVVLSLLSFVLIIVSLGSYRNLYKQNIAEILREE